MWVKTAALGMVLVVIAAAIVVAVQKAQSDSDKPPEVRALAPAPLSVTLAMLGDGAQLAMGGHAPIKVEATGPGIDSVTLWEDDRALSTLIGSGGTGTEAMVHTIEWTAVTPGAHIIHASAHGTNGTAHSSPISVTVAPAPGTPKKLVVSAPAGATPRAVAAAYGVDPAIVQEADAATSTASKTSVLTADGTTFSIDAARVLQAFPPSSAGITDEGTAPDVSASTTPTTKATATTVDPGTTAAPDTTEPSTPGGSGPATTKAATTTDDGSTDQAPSESADHPTETVGSPPVAPTATTLKVKRSGCTAHISATGANGPLVIYAADGGSVGFVEVGTLEEGKTFTSAPLTPGTHVFVAGRANEPTSTQPVSVTAPDSCISAIWKGNTSITGGILTIPAPDDGLLAVYLSADGKPAQRIPHDGIKLFTASTRHINLKPYLPSLAGKHLHLEVWSTSPTTNQSTQIATGDADLPEGMLPADLIGESAGADLSISPTAAKVVDDEIKGKWTTHAARADRVVWQVTTQPMDPTNPSLSPPGLVAWGISQAWGPAKDGVGHEGGFGIPISSLVRPKMVPITAKPVTKKVLQASKPVTNLPVEVAPAVGKATNFDLDALTDAAASDPEMTGGLATNLPVPSGSTYFIRVVPLHGVVTLGGASDSLRFDGVTPTDPPQVPLSPAKVTFDAGRVANPALTACVRVTSVPWNGRDQAQFYSAFFPTAGTYCPGDWKSSSDCLILPDWACNAWNKVVAAAGWLLEQAAKVWDVIATVYNKIVETVVTLVAYLNPYCIAATVTSKTAKALDAGKDVEKTADAAEDICHKVAKVAAKAVVSAIMSSFGLPPELPTSQQLLAIAKGDLKELAVAFLNQYVPCDELVIDADTAGAVSAGIKEAGGKVPAGVSDGVDVCRDAIGAVTDKVLNEIEGQLYKQIAASTGLPLPFAPIDGFSFELEPRGTYKTPTLAITADPKNPNPPMNGTCRATVRTDLMAKAAGTSPEPAFGTTQIDLRGIFGKVWIGNTAMTFNQLAGYKPPNAGLPQNTFLEAKITSGCIAFLGDGNGHSEYAYVRGPAGRWKPGDKD